MASGIRIFSGLDPDPTGGDACVAISSEPPKEATIEARRSEVRRCRDAKTALIAFAVFQGLVVGTHVSDCAWLPRLLADSMSVSDRQVTFGFQA